MPTNRENAIIATFDSHSQAEEIEQAREIMDRQEASMTEAIAA